MEERCDAIGWIRETRLPEKSLKKRLRMKKWRLL